jgi:hypothetical protein
MSLWKLNEVVEYWINGRIEYGTIKAINTDLFGNIESYEITFCNTNIINTIKPQYIVE